MAGGIHASSPGSATVTHQMGYSVLPPEYSLHSQTVLENGVTQNEPTNSNVNTVESSTSRKRKHSADATNYQLESKRMCIYNQLLTDMIIEKEKYLYFWLLNEYSRSDEKDFFGFINKMKFSDPFLPSPNPQQPKSIYFSSEPESFQKLFPSEVVSKLKNLKFIKQELNKSPQLSKDDHDGKTVSSPVVHARSSFRSSSVSVDSNSQQIVEKAKQEAQIYQRIGELQKLGLWTEKRLPKVQEPPRAKAHWDYVLEELEWLATDFAQERKWKKAAARKRSRMIQKHFQEREALVQKTARAAELHKRKIASHLAKMVKSFWNNVEKLVDFKQQTRLKEKRQQALDQHLSFIVDKTEKYSSLVAESMNKSASVAQENSRPLSPMSDVEFEPPNQISSDDEETIEAEEKGNSVDSLDQTKEIELLKQESQLPLEDLLNQLPEEYLNDVEALKPVNKTRGKVHDDDEYETDTDVSDDETTLLEEERIEGTVDYTSEIAELQADNDLSIEELMQKYKTADVDALEKSDASSHADSTSETEQESNDTTSEENTEDDDDVDEEESDGLISLLKDSTLENGDINDENAEEKIDNVAAIAESIQPKGNTLSSTCVVTKVPFLLKHSLREYQHIGLDWLVTMYERQLNGILADEMGLGKTIQTIALLAHLACDKENWGPHLIIVPTSVMLNWEMEFKKWCPAFKILTYYGNPKERKLKRAGWTKPNTFHVCITSYKLVLQDHHCFRRKKWKYLILDEAQNIKNFKSQRWQRLLNFDSERRLLLTGTPLQNNLMELWSLMHFLMPNLFSSHREFKEWFSNPVTGMIEGNSEYNENIIKRLHKVLRPFLLRRLKVEVEKQLPSKYEHIVMCRLSNRQRFLYDDFMSRAKTKETLSTGNLLSVINVLMQLRKVCNHPNLFEERPIISPFQMENINYHTASLVESALDYDPFCHVNLNSLNLQLISLENELSAWNVYRMKRLKVPRKLIEEIDEAPCEPPPVPKGKLNIRLKPPGDFNCFKVDNNVRNSQKIVTFLKSASVPATSNTNNVSTSVYSGTPVRIGPIFRTILGQGEVNNMAVKRNKTLDNVMPNRNSYAVQVKSIKGNQVHQKLCLTPGSKPIQALIRPVSIKNIVTCGETVTSTPTASASTVHSSFISSVTPSTVPSGVISGFVPASSVIAMSSGSSQIMANTNLSQWVTTSTGKQVIISSAGGIKSQPCNTSVKSGQRLILTKSVSGSPNSIVGSLIRIPNSSVQQGTIINNGTSSSMSTSIPSTIILNNSLKTSISIPKPISTSSVTSSSTNANTISCIPSSTVTRSKSEKKHEILPEATEVQERRKKSRLEKLRILANVNERKSSSYVMFGCDVRTTLKILDTNTSYPPVTDDRYWRCVGHVNCVNVQYAKHVHNLCSTLTSALANSVKSIEERIQELSDTFSRYIVYVPAVSTRRPTMHVSHPAPSKAWSLSYMECMLEKELAPRATNLHQIVSRMSTAFPDSRLIQYDCGKLQVLDTLLRRLKLEQHRVLIFTQMARMLNVLEAFLTFHGHIYLRLDGSTRIDQRQVLMERFNADKRYFCFILSTRSGGIGVNLTGADTVIFYDSDWNPTMDAQAQDRCHRIGQTRDVHIYRLISEKTVEENILKKANQKKLLGDLAIEGGNFTAAYFKSSTIHDLFNIDFDEADPAKRISDVTYDPGNSQPIEKTTLNAYENALAAAEDEPDVAAARTAKEEAVAELAEFDENIPLVDNDGTSDPLIPSEECSKAEQEVNALIEQLTPIERWALQFMETVDTEWAEEQLAAAEAEIEQQKKEWEMERIAIEQADARSKRLDEEFEDDDVPLTYSSVDAKNQTWESLDTSECMPIWLPLPTLLSVENSEMYIDRSLQYLYDTIAIPEHLLPPVYLRKEKKKLRLEQTSSNLVNENTSHIRVRNRHREGLSNVTHSVASLEPPKSLFDRPSSIVVKLRQDMRLQKYRGLPRSTIPNVPGLKPYFPPKISADPDFVPEWLIHEDYALLQAIQHVQELPLNLAVMYPGHIPNWDLVSELVNQVSRIYRSPLQCKNRFESAILPREEGKLTSDPITKKQKKLKGMNQMVSLSKYTRNYKTAQLYLQDSNSTFTQMMNARFDAIRGVSNRRAPTIKRLPLTTSTKNPKHAQLLAECEIDYERPLTPVEIAVKRAQRLAKEKQTQMATAEQLLLRQNTTQQQLAKQQQAQQQSGTPVQQVQQPAAMQQLQPQIPGHKTMSVSASNIVPQQTAVVVNISQNSVITTSSPVNIRNLTHRPINEVVVASSNLQHQQPPSVVIPQAKSTTTIASPNLISSSVHRIIPVTQISATGTLPASRIVPAGSKATSQVQLYKQQAIQQHQLKILHPRTKTPLVVPTSVVVSSPQHQRQQQSPQQQQTQPQQQQLQLQQQRQLQLKSIAGSVTSAGSRFTEAELAAILKKRQLQQQQKLASATVIATTSTPAVQTQLITTQAAAVQGKSTVGTSLPMKTATISASNFKGSPTAPQHIRQITIQQQVQQRKLQRVTPIGQVMVNVTQSGQGISHVLTKGSQGNVQTAAHLVGARVIPVVSSATAGKQALQVVSTNALRTATSPNVTIDATGTKHIQQALPSNTIRISGNTSTLSVAALAQQQLINQLVQNQSLVHSSNLKIQNTGIVSATAASVSGTATLSSPSQLISMPATQPQTSNSDKKGL